MEHDIKDYRNLNDFGMDKKALTNKKKLKNEEIPQNFDLISENLRIQHKKVINKIIEFLYRKINIIFPQDQYLYAKSREQLIKGFKISGKKQGKESLAKISYTKGNVDKSNRWIKRRLDQVIREGIYSNNILYRNIYSWLERKFFERPVTFGEIYYLLNMNSNSLLNKKNRQDLIEHLQILSNRSSIQGAQIYNMVKQLCGYGMTGDIPYVMDISFDQNEFVEAFHREIYEKYYIAIDVNTGEPHQNFVLNNNRGIRLFKQISLKSEIFRIMHIEDGKLQKNIENKGILYSKTLYYRKKPNINENIIEIKEEGEGDEEEKEEKVMYNIELVNIWEYFKHMIKDNSKGYLYLNNIFSSIFYDNEITQQLYSQRNYNPIFQTLAFFTHDGTHTINSMRKKILNIIENAHIARWIIGTKELKTATIQNWYQIGGEMNLYAITGFLKTERTFGIIKEMIRPDKPLKSISESQIIGILINLFMAASISTGNRLLDIVERNDSFQMQKMFKEYRKKILENYIHNTMQSRPIHYESVQFGYKHALWKTLGENYSFKRWNIKVENSNYLIPLQWYSICESNTPSQGFIYKYFKVLGHHNIRYAFLNPNKRRDIIHLVKLLMDKSKIISFYSPKFPSDKIKANKLSLFYEKNNSKIDPYSFKKIIAKESYIKLYTPINKDGDYQQSERVVYVKYNKKKKSENKELGFVCCTSLERILSESSKKLKIHPQKINKISLEDIKSELCLKSINEMAEILDKEKDIVLSYEKLAKLFDKKFQLIDAQGKIFWLNNRAFHNKKQEKLFNDRTISIFTPKTYNGMIKLEKKGTNNKWKQFQIPKIEYEQLAIWIENNTKKRSNLDIGMNIKIKYIKIRKSHIELLLKRPRGRKYHIVKIETQITTLYKKKNLGETKAILQSFFPKGHKDNFNILEFTKLVINNNKLPKYNPIKSNSKNFQSWHYGEKKMFKEERIIELKFDGRAFLRHPKSNLQLFGQKQMKKLFRASEQNYLFRISRRAYKNPIKTLKDKQKEHIESPKTIILKYLKHTHKFQDSINKMTEEIPKEKRSNFIYSIGFLKKINGIYGIPKVIFSSYGQRTKIKIAHYSIENHYNDIQNGNHALRPDGLIFSPKREEFWLEEFSEAMEIMEFYRIGGAESYLANLATKHIAYQSNGYPAIQIVPNGKIDRVSYKKYYKDFFEIMGIQVPVLTIKEVTLLRRALESKDAIIQNLGLLEVSKSQQLVDILTKIGLNTKSTEIISKEFSKKENPKWIKLFKSINCSNNSPIYLQIWGSDVYKGPLELSIEPISEYRISGKLLREKLINEKINVEEYIGVKLSNINQNLAIFMLNHHQDRIIKIADNAHRKGLEKINFKDEKKKFLFEKLNEWAKKEYKEDFR